MEGTRMVGLALSRWAAVVPMVLCLVGSARPAWAGHYECTDVSGGGTVSVFDGYSTTTTALEDGYGNPYPTFGPVTLWGGGQSVSYSFHATYSFIWVPDENVDGPDDPVGEDDYFDFTGNLQWNGNSGFQDHSAGCNGHWSISVTGSTGTDSASWEGNMSSTPNDPDPPTINQSGIWGDVPGQLAYALSGMTPTVDVDIEGGLGTSGVGQGSIALNAPAIGQGGGEGIWHLFPTQRSNHAPTVPFTPNGVWRGNNGSTYRIRFEWTYGQTTANGVEEQTDPLDPPRDNLAGTRRAIAWTGNSITPLNRLKAFSIAHLDKKQGNNYIPDCVNPSRIVFNGN